MACRSCPVVAALVDFEVSDFPGYARYLRGFAAKTKFTSWEPLGSPEEDALLDRCNSIWTLLFYREMVRGMIRDGRHFDERRMVAGMMNIISGFQAQLQYVEDSNERVLGLFGQFSDEVIAPSIGLSIDEVLEGFALLRELIPERMNRVVDLGEGARRFHQMHNAAPQHIQSVEDMRDYLESKPGFRKAGEDFQESMVLGAKLFVFEPADFHNVLGEESENFLEAFSFQPGTVNVSYSLPFDVSVHRSRPFARLDEGYFLVDPIYCYFSPQYRLVECFSTERLRERLTKRRDTELEDVAARLFAETLGEGATYRSYYIPINQHCELAERDLLHIHDDTAFIIESKARPLRDARANIDKIEGDFKRTIQAGYEQCVSVCEYLTSGGKVPIFDSNKADRKVIAEINTETIKRVVPIVFLDSYYGYISTDPSPWLKADETVGLPWVVDRDAMSSFTLKFSDPSTFVEFFDWRRSAYGVAVNEDELCFAGYFLRHGPNEFPKGADLVQLDQNYSDVFEEEYFRRKGHDVPDSGDFVGAPHWSGMQRDGEDVVFSLNGKVKESINTVTGISTKPGRKRKHKNKIGRNEPCPCNSGKKYKKCCGRPDH